MSSAYGKDMIRSYMRMHKCSSCLHFDIYHRCRETSLYYLKLESKMWKQSQLFLLCITHYYLISFGVQCTTKYYVTRNELKKRFDDQLIINPGAFKKSASSLKDPIQVSNSNTYLVDSTGYIGGESNELADYGDHEGAFAHKLVAIDRKASKFFGDEVSFVIVVVTLTVFFGILS